MALDYLTDRLPSANKKPVILLTGFYWLIPVLGITSNLEQSQPSTLPILCVGS